MNAHKDGARPLDLAGSIEITRERVRQVQADYSDANFREDRIKKPLMFYVLFDKRFDPQFRDQRILLERGKVVWGAIIQANQMLFEQGDVPNLPAGIIYSAETDYDGNPALLNEHGTRMYDLKGQKCDPKMQAFADKLANELVADIKLPIPRGFTDGVTCFYATLLMARKHLPFKRLANNFFPVLIAPDDTDTVMVLPKGYWDPEFKKAWSRI